MILRGNDCLRHKKFFAIFLIMFLIIVSVEIYAFSYIKIDNLNIVNPKDALNLPGGAWFNGSFTFSSNGAKWLILFQLTNRTSASGEGVSWIYIFKIAQNTSFGIINLNIVPEKVNLSATPDYDAVHEESPFFTTGGPGRNSYTSPFNNYTFVTLGYQVSSGVYNVDFAFTFRVYETTLLGVVPLNQATINFSGQITIPAY